MLVDVGSEGILKYGGIYDDNRGGDRSKGERERKRECRWEKRTGGKGKGRERE